MVRNKNTTEMMPDRYVLILKSFSDITITIIGFIMLFSWSAVVAVIQICVVIFYWLPTIYHKNVKKYHNGSWTSYLKDVWRIIIGKK